VDQAVEDDGMSEVTTADEEFATVPAVAFERAVRAGGRVRVPGLRGVAGTMSGVARSW
jgi:hypothetical protein